MQRQACLQDIGPMCDDTATYESVDATTWSQLTLFAAASPAKTYQWPAAARVWLESAADFGTSTIAFLQSLGRAGLLSRMSPACYPATADGTLPPSFAGWSNAGMASPTGFLTHSISEWPSDAAVCSLSAVLETETDVAPKYFLSQRAAAGILRRAEKRGKNLPPRLQEALQALAAGIDQG